MAPAPKPRVCKAATSQCLLTLPTHRPQSSPTHRADGARVGSPIAQGEKQKGRGKPGKLQCLGAQGMWGFFLFSSRAPGFLQLPVKSQASQFKIISD